MDEINHTTEQGNTAGSNTGTPHKRRKHRTRAGTVGRVVGTIGLIGLLTCVLLACFASVYIKTVIMPQSKITLVDFTMDLTTTMYYTDKDTGEDKQLQTFHGTENRTWVSYADIPTNMVNAAVAIEDKRFYDHGGVDWIRTAKGVINMFTGKDIQGGSTITQQLIKNITTDDEVTVKRKITEIFRALEFEKNYSKDEILEWYLNYINLGGGCYGIYSASYYYFGKPVQELSLAECASIVSITNNPSLYNPYLHVDYNKSRQELVLDCMCEQGKITQEECDAAKAEKLNFVKGEDEIASGNMYSWFEEQVISDVINDLVDTYDYDRTYAFDLFYSGGLEIYTTVDPKVQAAVENVYYDQANIDYTSKSGQKMQSAITIIDNATGNVVGMAGGVGQKASNRGWNMATDTKRQPGSSIKPLTVYSPALELGRISPGTVIDDYPYTVLNGNPWPRNSDNRYKGLTTVYNALTNSVNTVAVRIVADYLTPQVSFDFAETRYHITSLEDNLVVGNQVKNDIGLSQMALGGLTSGVNTLEMAAAYTVFPNEGVYTKPRTYTKVLDSKGNVLLDNESESEVAIKETTAFYMNYMLKNVVASGTGTAAAFSGMTIAGKTGTTTDNYDRWFVGYTPYYTAAVWSGYATAEKMNTSGNPSVVMWRKVMSQIHEGLENKSFSTPNSIVSVSYCMDSGLLPSDDCLLDPRGSRVTKGYFIQGEDVPTEYCTLHTTVRVCKDCPILDADGKETGLYHLAGPNCPESSIITESLLNYTREAVGNATAEDSKYLLSYTEAAGQCTVHTGTGTDPVTGDAFDEDDPTTWPTDDPNFDINDPTTWPGYVPETTTPTTPTTPTETQQPTETTTPSQGEDDIPQDILH